MDLSAKMPATQDSTLDAKMPATMASDAPPTGGGGSMEAPQTEISQTTDTGRAPTWENASEGNLDWQTVDKKTGPEWEASDRQEG